MTATITRNETDWQQLKQLLSERAAERRPVTLASGKQSDYYIDGKQVTLDQDGAYLVGKLLFEAIRQLQAQAVGGLETGAIPIVSTILQVARAEGVPLVGFWSRKQPKEHGKMLQIEGPLKKGMSVVIVDDVITTGASALSAAQKVEEVGCQVLKVLALVDREEGAQAMFVEAGIAFEALFTARDLFDE